MTAVREFPPPLCPLTALGMAQGWNTHAEFLAVYYLGPPFVDDLGEGYYRPWLTGHDPRFGVRPPEAPIVARARAEGYDLGRATALAVTETGLRAAGWLGPADLALIRTAIEEVTGSHRCPVCNRGHESVVGVLPDGRTTCPLCAGWGSL